VFTAMMSVAAGVSGAVGMALFRDAAGPRALSSARGYRRARSVQRWAAGEMRRHDWTAVLQAGRALGTYDATSWIGAIDVPVAVVVTDRDRAIPPAAQLAFAARIPGATVHHVDGGHTVCAGPALAGPLLDACREVAARAGLTGRAASGM
jgi:pimeloyl-ACP methyl ester carboxylesterase